MSSLNPHLAAHTHGHDGLHADHRRPSTIGLRLRVYCRRRRLDEMLADGASPKASPELTLRAGQLTGERHRRALADSLEAVVATAQGSIRGRSATPPLARRDVRAASAALIGLARDLREDANVDSRGVALTQRLLTDGTGPIYIYGPNDALWHAAREATAALHA
ncbi:MAG TPA: hypothetical protein VK252_05950 [Solirubrobacteraceae bacterium]|nr:hypothetical protein [Solirubrobacteraceae bacterium]